MKHRKKGAISPPVGMKAKSTSRHWGCLGADEDWVICGLTSEALPWKLLLFKLFLFTCSFPTLLCYWQRKGESEKQEELVRVTEHIRALQVHRIFTQKDYFRAHPPTHITVQKTETLGINGLFKVTVGHSSDLQILTNSTFPRCTRASSFSSSPSSKAS